MASRWIAAHWAMWSHATFFSVLAALALAAPCVLALAVRSIRRAVPEENAAQILRRTLYEEPATCSLRPNLRKSACAAVALVSAAVSSCSFARSHRGRAADRNAAAGAAAILFAVRQQSGPVPGHRRLTPRMPTRAPDGPAKTEQRGVAAVIRAWRRALACLGASRGVSTSYAIWSQNETLRHGHGPSAAQRDGLLASPRWTANAPLIANPTSFPPPLAATSCAALRIPRIFPDRLTLTQPTRGSRFGVTGDGDDPSFFNWGRRCV